MAFAASSPCINLLMMWYPWVQSLVLLSFLSTPIPQVIPCSHKALNNTISVWWFPKGYLQAKPFSKFQTCISIYLLTTSTLKSNRHLKVNMSKTKLLIFHPETHSIYSLTHLSWWQYILQGTQTKILRSSLILLFLSSLPYRQQVFLA